MANTKLITIGDAFEGRFMLADGMVNECDPNPNHWSVAVVIHSGSWFVTCPVTVVHALGDQDDRPPAICS